MSPRVEAIAGVVMVVAAMVWTYVFYAEWGMPLLLNGALYGGGLIVLGHAAYRHADGRRARFWTLWALLLVLGGAVIPSLMRAATAHRFTVEQRTWER